MQIYVVFLNECKMLIIGEQVCIYLNNLKKDRFPKRESL
jgi:thioredoxin-related protein